MKLSTIAAFSIGLGLAVGQVQVVEGKTAPTTPAAQTAAGSSSLATQKDKVSYTIGVSIGQTLKSQNIDFDSTILLSGIKDATTGAKPLMTQEEMAKTMDAYSNEIKAKHEAEVKQLSDKNAKEGNDFLAANKAKAGVIVLPSGLQYQIVTPAEGEKPGDTDMVTVDYEGKLPNGAVFDSSIKRGKPVTFQVSQVIPGWTEILKMMPKGSTWEVVIPPSLAYGEHGVGSMIGPNQTLIFRIHLIDVKAPSKSPAGSESSTSTTIQPSDKGTAENNT